MAYFKIEEPDKPVKWIKKVNGADGTLEFTDNINDAYYQDSGFFADSEKGFIEFHFMEKYPEIQYMTLDNGRDYNNGPIDPNAQGMPLDIPPLEEAIVMGGEGVEQIEAPGELAWEIEAPGELAWA